MTGRRGFSLVEVMVALGVLAVMYMVVSSLLLSTAAVSDNDAELKTAAADLQAAMEAINGTPFDNIVPTYPNNQALPAFNDLHLDNEVLKISYTDPAATNPLQINLTVTWKGSGGNGGLAKSKRLTGLRVR